MVVSGMTSECTALYMSHICCSHVYVVCIAGFLLFILFTEGFAIGFRSGQNSLSDGALVLLVYDVFHSIARLL